MTALLSNQLPEGLGVLLHPVGDVDFVGAVSREGRVQGEDSVFGELLQLLLVDVVLVLVAATEEQVRLADGFALLLLPGAFLDEPPERGQTRPRADHDDRGLRSIREPELRPANEAGDLEARVAVRDHGLQPGCGHPLVCPARLCGVLDNDRGDVDPVFVDSRGGGDGIETGLQAG